MSGSRQLAVRVAIAAIAALATAWFVLGIVQAHAVGEATAIVDQNGDVSAHQAARVNSLLDTASTLNPDSTVDILHGQLQRRLGDSAAARRWFSQVTRREPENVLAWDLLAQAGDISALAHVAALEPPVRSR